MASSRGGTQTEGTGGTLENEQARQRHFPLADPRARRTGVHQLTPRLHLHLIQAYALVHAGEFQCSSPPASLSQQTGETSLGAIVVTPFSNRPRRPPSPALAPRISGPRAKISSWHTYRARTSRRALKRNCIQPPRRISARVTLPRVPATANRSGIVIPVHGGGVCFGILWRLSLAILGATWSTCRRLALNADFWYFSFFREYY